jgi:hypothetical protein
LQNYPEPEPGPEPELEPQLGFVGPEPKEIFLGATTLHWEWQTFMKKIKMSCIEATTEIPSARKNRFIQKLELSKMRYRT